MNVLGNFIDKFSAHQAAPQPQHPEPVVEVKPQLFILPEITLDDHKRTMNHYRAHVQKVNDVIEAGNEAIDRYNKKVNAYTAANPPGMKEAFITLFHQKNDRLEVEEYNQEAAEFNENHGFYILKKRLKTVKPVTLQVFEGILHAYTVQLRTFVGIWQKTAKITATKLPKADIHPVEIAAQERGEGVLNLNLSSRTIRRHRDILERMGVLQGKEYRGTKRPNRYWISPQILSVSEAFLPKMQNAENQSLHPEKLTDCQHTKVLLDHNRKEKEIKGIVNSERRCSPEANAFKIVFYKTTDMQEKEIFSPAREKNAPGAKNFAPAAEIEYKNHLLGLETIYEIAQKNASGANNHYIPLKMETLNAWLGASYVNKEDFLRICLQDFAKAAAAINKHNQAGAGSWYLALQQIEKDFGCVNFTGRAMSKDVVLQKLIEFRYRLRWALGWFARREWTNTPFANLYFDPYRKLSSDVCWQYTSKVWSKKMKKITKAAAVKKQKAADLARRTDALSEDRQNRKKMDNAIYRYLRKEITFTDLTAYIVKELPEEYRAKFGPRLDELNQRRLIN